MERSWQRMQRMQRMQRANEDADGWRMTLAACTDIELYTSPHIDIERGWSGGYRHHVH